jgi:hypothetical protein
VSLPVPLPWHHPVLVPAEGEPRADILEVLRDTGHRLSTMQLLEALQRAGKVHGESTIKRKLAEMVAGGELTNEQRTTPRGYGLPSWQD